MKFAQAAVFAALIVASSLPAQAIDWQRIVGTPTQKLGAEALSPAERHDLEAAIVASNTVWDDCEGDTDWPHQIEVHRVNLAAGHYTLAEAGPGCSRSGQGANGAMWLVRWNGTTPVILGELDGGFRAVLPQVSLGMHDVAVAWHNDANNYGLTLYRFDGKKYRLVDGTDVHCDESTHVCHAVPGVQRSTGRPSH